MIDDLLERRLLIGRSVSEIAEWLGPPFPPRGTESGDLQRKLTEWDFAFRAGSLRHPPSAVWEATYVVVRTDDDLRVVAAGVVLP